MKLTDEQINSIVVKAIQVYLNNDKFDSSYIISNFAEAIIIATEEFKERMNQPSNIISMTQGARSVTYKDVGIGSLSDNIKMLLPKPYLRKW